MALSFTEKRSIRRNFGKLKEILSIPNLIDVQKESYSQFLKVRKKAEFSSQKGLEKVKNMLSYVESENLKVQFKVFGETSHKVDSDKMTILGKYHVDNIAEIIDKESIDVFFTLSKSLRLISFV